jgi:Dynamin family
MIDETNQRTAEEIKLPRKQEIKDHLPDATSEQVERFATQVERLELLTKYLQKYSTKSKKSYQNISVREDEENLHIILANAKKKLNYKRPYRIAVIGTTGAGKSTFINALLGDDIVLTKTVGRPATGAVLEIFFDIPETEPRKAIVMYRDEKNIRRLIYDFTQRYELDVSWLNRTLDLGFANQLLSIEPQQKITEAEARTNFERLRETLADIVVQYANNNNSNLRCEFFLDHPKDIQDLKELTDEYSSINAKNSSTRKIGLIQTVTYHLHSARSNTAMQALQLPKNVCLVDLPGLDGSALHNIIITEGIKEADAVIYIQRPRRIDTDSDLDLLSNVRKYISLEGSAESNESIFFVLNGRDTITEDQIPANLTQDMRDQIEKFLPGYTKHPTLCDRGSEGNPFFLISAWAALQAQKALGGKIIEDPDTYDAVKLKLGVRDGNHYQVMQASQVPKLIEELTKFARDRRIEAQIRDGKLAIDTIVDSLYDDYQNEYSTLTRNRGEYYLQEKEENKLKERQQELEKALIKFRLDNELGYLENRRKELETQAKTICNETDKDVQEKMPLFWKNNFKSGIDRLGIGEVGKLLYEPMLTEAQIYLWDKLNARLPSLAKYLVRGYTENLRSYRLAQRIADSCYEYKKVQELESAIQELINTNMRRAMIDVGQRIAMTKMTNPGTYFTALTPDGKPQKPQLLDILSKIPRIPDVDSSDFDEFIKQVRQEYEPLVSGYCVICLLNLYRYEMIQIENFLLNLIADIFRGIRNSDNPILKAKIRDSLKLDSEWRLAELIAEKIATLFQIKQLGMMQQPRASVQ